MEHYEGICSGSHYDKEYWITGRLECDVPDKLIGDLLSHTVDEAVKEFPCKTREPYLSRQTPHSSSPQSSESRARETVSWSKPRPKAKR